MRITILLASFGTLVAGSSGCATLGSQTSGGVSKSFGQGACLGDLEIRARDGFEDLATQAKIAGMQRVGIASFLQEDSAGTMNLVWNSDCGARLLVLAATAFREHGLLAEHEWPVIRPLRNVAQSSVSSRTDEILLENGFRHEALYDVSLLPEIMRLAAPPDGLDGLLLGRYERGGELLLSALLVNSKGEFITPHESAAARKTENQVLALILMVDSAGSMEDNDPHAYRTDGARMVARTVAMVRDPTGFVLELICPVAGAVATSWPPMVRRELYRPGVFKNPPTR